MEASPQPWPVDLSFADLMEANLYGTILVGANLCMAFLANANLYGADLSGADLSGAQLGGANLINAVLTGSNLTKTSLFETVFGNTDLREVQGLDACVHQGPSIIDHRTFALSGPLPLSFLRGCGLPDEFIECLPSLLHQAIQFYSCFISYSTHDQEFADRLYADLQNKNVRCWFAPHDIQAGKKIHEQIDEAIGVYDRLLLILSAASMSSEWVKTEIAKARKRETREHQRVLFPVRIVDFETLRDWECFDADTGKDLAREIREYFIQDFSDWKNDDKYRDAFARLIRDLKAEDNTPPKVIHQ
jgi:hypothetical protein